jgi:hypothetical protein
MCLALFPEREFTKNKHSSVIKIEANVQHEGRATTDRTATAAIQNSRRNFIPSASMLWFDDFDLEVHDLIVFLQLISGWAPGFTHNDAELPDLMLFIWDSAGHEIATMPSRAISPFQGSISFPLVLFLGVVPGLDQRTVGSEILSIFCVERRKSPAAKSIATKERRFLPSECICLVMRFSQR